MVSPARATRSGRGKSPDLPVQDGEHLLEVVPVRRRPSARRNVHVDEGVPAGRVLAGDEDGVRVSDEPDVRQALIFVWPCDGDPARRVVGRDRSRLDGMLPPCGFNGGFSDGDGDGDVVNFRQGALAPQGAVTMADELSRDVDKSGGFRPL